MLGTLVMQGIVDEKLAIESYAGTPTVRCWYLLHNYVQETRKRRGHFCRSYEDFAKRCLDYYTKQGITVKLDWDGEEEKEPVDVLGELQKDGVRPRRLKKTR